MKRTAHTVLFLKPHREPERPWIQARWSRQLGPFGSRFAELGSVTRE